MRNLNDEGSIFVVKAEDKIKVKLSVGMIEESVKLTEDTFHLIVATSGICEDVSPGQFFMIRGWQGLYPLLRRPFSVSDMKGDRLYFIIKNAGRGTQLITELVKGDKLSLLGPLGRGFVLNGNVQRHIFVAGGVGIAPFPLLAKALKESNPSGNVELLYGEKDATRLIDADCLDLVDIRVLVATEDGSAGRRGLVNDLLYERLAGEGGRAAIYACGPRAMLREIQIRLFDYPGPLQFSLESYMGCGLGSCMGCVIGVTKNGKKSYSRVCCTGPVFDGREVVF